MIVRAYDREQKEYFVSEVYAILDKGYFEKYLVLQKTSHICGYRLIDYLHKSSDEHNLEVNINIISTNDLEETWVEVQRDSFYYRGYSYILEKEEQIVQLLKGIILEEDTWKGHNCDTRLKGWNYIEKREEIETLMNDFHYFHDSVLTCLKYISGAGKAEDGGMYVNDGIRQITMNFDSDWADSIEMVFEGVIKLNLCPAADNYLADIYSAVLEKEQEIITFYAGDKKEIQEQDGTWIKAYGLRWRFL